MKPSTFFRSLSIALFIVTSISCIPTKKTFLSQDELKGVWIPVRQEFNGAQMPAASFEKYKLTITDSLYFYGATQDDKGTLTYKDGKMDIYGKEGPNAGKHITAIYKLVAGINGEKDELTICYNLPGTGYPASFDTKGKSTYFLSVFKKN